MTPSIAPDASRVATIVLSKIPVDRCAGREPHFGLRLARYVRIAGPEHLLEHGAMARLGIDVREPLSDHVLLRETHLRELRGAHDREAQVRTEEHAYARGRVAERFVQPEALRLRLGARLLEIDVGAGDAPAEIPPDAERGENSDEGDEDSCAGQPV